MDASHESPPQDTDISFSTFIGVIVAICGNVLISVALNLQKMAHNRIRDMQISRYLANMDETPHWASTTQAYYSGSAFFPDDGYSSPRSSVDIPQSEEEDALEHQKFISAVVQEQSKNGDTDYLRSKLWWLGITLMVVGEVGNFVAYGFAPASTIAPLGTTTLVSNVILAPLMLHELFRQRDLIGVFLAVFGAATVVFSSNGEETALTPDLIMEALTQTRTVVYVAVTAVVIAALTILSPVYGAQSIMIDLGLVAIYGGYTVLCTKSVSSLLSLTLFKMFTFPLSYVLIFILVVTAILQVVYLNRALQRFDSTEVIPTQFVLFTVSAIIGSAIIYHDFDDMSLNQTTRFMTGCFIEFLGVYLITSKRNKQTSPPLSIQADGNSVSFLAPDHSESTTDNRDDEQHSFSQPLQYASRPGVQAFRSSTIALPEERLGAPDTAAAAAAAVAAATAQRDRHRRSSVFRGVSLTSQLVDRMNEEPLADYSLQLSSSPTFVPRGLSLSHRRSGSVFGHRIGGLSTMNNTANSEAESDAVEIEIPTAFTLSAHKDDDDNSNDNQSNYRELDSMHSRSNHLNERSSRLVDIQEQREDNN